MKICQIVNAVKQFREQADKSIRIRYLSDLVKIVHKTTAIL